MTSAMSPVCFLLVDDLEENLLALEALLHREGLACLKARSGEEALELLLVHDFALALIDVQMPGLNGFELAELMRGNERTRRVPIIFVTAGNADRQRRFRGYEAGAVDFIQKPIEADILRHKANVFFDLNQQRRQIVAQRDELEAYGEGLSDKTEFVTLNKIDALDPDTREERAAALEAATGQKPFLVSGVSGEGVTELLRAAYAEVRRGRAEANAGVEHEDWRP